MNAAPRSVRRLWALLGAVLTLGLAGYVHFFFTGSYDVLVAFFRHVGAVFFLSTTSTEAYFAHQARHQFDITEPMHTTWTMVFLGACCRLTGAVLTQVLSQELAWNPLVALGVFHSVRSGVLRDVGLVVGGPMAMALLAGGLMRVINLTPRLRIVRRLTTGDRILIAVILLFTARQMFEIGVILFGARVPPPVTQALLWFSDPLLALLLMQAVSIRRSVLNLGEGLVARCWGMMALGVAFSSAGDVALWAESHSLVPAVLSPLGWFVWFFAATAYACAPCYQVEAARQAHKGSYSVLFTQG